MIASGQVYLPKKTTAKNSLISLKDWRLVIPDGIIGVFHVFLGLIDRTKLV